MSLSSRSNSEARRPSGQPMSIPSFVTRFMQDISRGQHWLPLAVLTIAAGTAHAATDNEARVREQTQLAQWQTQAEGITPWGLSFQSESVALKTGDEGLLDLRRELNERLVSVRERQQELGSEWRTVRADRQQLTSRLSGMMAQAHSLTETPHETPIEIAQADNQGSNRSVVQLVNQMEALNGELNKLRGKIEELGHGIVNAEKRQRDMYLDLDTRMRRLEQAVAAAQKKEQDNLAALEERLRKLEQSSQAGAIPTPVTSTNVNDSPAPGPISSAAAAPGPAGGPAAPDPQRLYDQALSSYRSGDYATAAAGFQSFLKQFPQHGLADNAQYWTGETHFQLRDYKAAVDAQRKLMASYPNSPKIPDALLNMGSAELGLGDPAAARKAWEELVAKHPDSEAADKARQRLARLR
jgi:tol-pal system protein YbgF